ncbi:MAG: hypothetical protein H6Q69_1152 [Firmicutes bacterium]|nr:hypothetical protein [Bacillota bacterium]
MTLPEVIIKGINEIDSLGFHRHLSEFALPMRKIMTEAEDKEDLAVSKFAQFEIDALRLHPQSFVISRDYSRRMQGEIDVWPVEQLNYYKWRFETSTNPQLACHYGDILLDYKGSNKIDDKYLIFTKIIPMFLGITQLAISQPEKDYFSLINALSRSVELCLSFNNAELLQKTVDGIIEFIKDIGSAHDYRWILEPSEMLFGVIKNPRVANTMNTTVINLVMNKLDEARINWLSCKNYYMHRVACGNLIIWKKRNGGTPEEINNLEKEIGLSFEMEAEDQPGRVDKSEIVKAHFLEQALQHYINIGETLKYDDLKNRIKRAYTEAEKTEFKEMRAAVNIPEDKINACLEIYRKESDLQKILGMLCIDTNINLDAIKTKEVSEELLKQSVLRALIPASGISGGRKISQSTTYEENLETEFRRHYIMCLSLGVNLLLIPIFELLKEKGLTAESIIEVYKKWDFYNYKREELLQTGVQRLLDGDYVSALHVLVPQFEACLRDMFFGADVATTVVRPGIIQHEQVMTEFLLRDEVKEALGEDFHTYICTVMISQDGWNLRNDIAHGLAMRSVFDISHALVVFHLFIRLFNYGLKKASEEQAQEWKG